MKITSVLSLILLTLNLTSCGQNHNYTDSDKKLINSAVVGGKKVQDKQFESVVGIVNEQNKLVCTGNLVNSKQILSAAHCVLALQMDQMSAMMTFMALQNGVNVEIDKAIKSGELTEAQLNGPLNKVIIRQYAFKTIDIYLDRIAKSYSIYVGNGEQGVRENLEVLKNKIVNVKFTQNYKQLVFNYFFGRSQYADHKNDRIEDGISPDQIVITLENEVKGIKPVAYINEEEAKSILVNDETEMIVAGFGKKMDYRESASRSQVLGFLNEKLKDEMKQEVSTLNQKQISMLRKNIATLTTKTKQDEALLKTEGDKNYTSIKVRNTDSFITLSNFKKEVPSQEEVKAETDKKDEPQMSREEFIALQKKLLFEAAINEELVVEKETKLNGVCQGDSGGPAFVKLPNGELRQAGVIVAVDFCGVSSYIAPISL